MTAMPGMNFEHLFTEMDPEDLHDNIFKLVGKDFFVVTAGTKEHYNSMTASGGGLVLLFRRPATLCILREDRYTLELMKEEQVYTISYFPDDYKKQVLFLGSASGRASNKMEVVDLSPIQTPSGTPTYAEARLVFECSLMALTTPQTDDFVTPETRELTEKGFQEAGLYRKYVFGEITHLWAKQ